MSKPIIETFGLGKKYQIHSPDKASANGGLANRLMSSVFNRKKHDVWALRHLNIQIERGDIVAVVGGNGSGKSTLFRLLSQISGPSEGEVILRGSVSCMLEAGVGFHDELSGRENIYLNGTLLGMTRGDIDQQFDDIVSFSEVGDYLNVPVKKYSSGMYVRLAFAVASFLRTDILLIDEVLSVGDESFRRKAIKRMKQMADEGCTILMVSHDTNILKSLCSSGIYIEQGKVVGQGSLSDILTDAKLDA